MKTYRLIAVTTGLVLILTSMTSPVKAEDTEVFFTNENPNAPNVLFVLDTSGSMKETVSGTGGKNRMQVLQSALNEVLSREYLALNVGIMDFNRSRGGGIDFPVASINSDASDIDPDIPTGTQVSQILGNIVNNYAPRDATPIADALYQASSYFLGSPIYNSQGSYGRPHSWNNTSNKYTGGHSYSDHPASYEGGTWLPRLPGTLHTHTSSCWKDRPASDAYSCFNTRFIDYNCAMRPASPLVCYLRKQTCDSTGQECSWAVIDSYSYAITDPDGADNGYDVRCSGPRPARETCAGVRESYDAGFDNIPNYKSPIEGQCQNNYIVLLSDGEPTARRASTQIAKRVEPITGGTTRAECQNLDTFGPPIDEHGLCLPDLTQYMREVDQAPDLLGEQTITTYTVGFALDGAPKAQDFLKLLSDNNHGQGKYFDASSPDELVSVFKNIIDDVTDNERRFVAPSVRIAQDNRLATSEYVYMSQFTPSQNPSWKGDITRQKITPTGFSTDTPISLADTLGTTRRVYTYTGNLPISRSVDLTGNKHRVEEGNADLTLALLGLAAGDESTRTNVIRWARGIDSNDADSDGDSVEAHRHMGDPLHSKPALVSYAGGKDVLYATTNDGYLHAFNVSTGTSPYEMFSFIPQTLLANLKTLYNNVNTDSKVYGLDGGMTIWQNATEVTLYLGMRRGGRNYYALDVSNPERPKLKWVIQGGIPGTDFEELGQSWSTPILTRVKDNGVEKMALVFAGGYDVNQDSTETRADDSMGRAVFIVDAVTGKRLWSAGPDNSHDLKLSGMKNSIPAAVRAIDFNGDGLTDRLYFGDTGARVWRVDLNTDDLANSTGYQLADFNNGAINDNRRFYYAPSIAFSRQGELKIAIGSGYRAHPLAIGVQDRFYVFKDHNAALGTPATTPSIIRDTHLLAAGSATSTLGWYLNLAENEKNLSTSLIFNNKVIFTTYAPEFGGNGNNSCNLANTRAQAYMVTLNNGQSAFSNNTNEPTIELTIDSIPGSPYVVFNTPGEASDVDSQTADMYVDTQRIDQIGQLTERLHWRKER